MPVLPNVTLAMLQTQMIENIDPAAVAAYRADRLKLWQSIAASYAAYVKAAMTPINECIEKQKVEPALKCPDKGTALLAAGKSVRGEVRAFVFNLLPHVPQQAAVDFILSAPKNWGIESEILLDDKSIPNLINVALPNLQWVQDQDEIDKAKAELDGTFKDWMTKSMTRLDQVAGGTGEILKKGADTAFGVVADVGEGIGTGLKKVGEGVGSAFKYVAIGAVAIGGIGFLAWIFTRKKKK